MTQPTSVDNGSEKKSVSASPAEIAKKAARSFCDWWQGKPPIQQWEIDDIEALILSAIKEARAPLEEKVAELEAKLNDRS